MSTPAAAVRPPYLSDEEWEAVKNCVAEEWQQAKPPPVPAAFRTPSPREAVRRAFELVGGIPRFAAWANEDYRSFILGPFSKIIAAPAPGTADEPFHIKISAELKLEARHSAQERVIDGQVVPLSEPTPQQLPTVEVAQELTEHKIPAV